MSDVFAWTVFGTMTAILIGVMAMLGTALFRLTDRIDNLGSSLGARIDDQSATLGARINKLGVRLDARIDEQSATLGARIDGLGTRIDGLSTRIDGLDTGMDGLATMVIAQGDRLDKRLEALQ